jgi:hypothetical protein
VLAGSIVQHFNTQYMLWVMLNCTCLGHHTRRWALHALCELAFLAIYQTIIFHPHDFFVSAGRLGSGLHETHAGAYLV